MTVTYSFTERMRVLQAFQSQCLRRDHADLAAEPQYRLIGEFFFTEMYGPKDFSNRDAQARRLHQFVHLVPGMGMRDVEQVIDLLDLTQQLDDALAHTLADMDAPLDFDEPLYDRAYRLADNYAARMEQLELVRVSLQNVARLARSPMLGIAMRRTEGLARAVGMADIHHFLLLGYQAVRPVRDMNRFIETVYAREKTRLDRIYNT